jgi:hypothetical protein
MTSELPEKNGPAQEKLDSFWVKFRNFRRSRPFWAGVFALIAGLELLYPPYATMKVQDITIAIHTLGGVSSLLIGIILICCGVGYFIRPWLRVPMSIVTFVLGLIAFVTANLGGFIIGTLCCFAAAALGLAWTPKAKEHKPTKQEQLLAETPESDSAKAARAATQELPTQELETPTDEQNRHYRAMPGLTVLAVATAATVLLSTSMHPATANAATSTTSTTVDCSSWDWTWNWLTHKCDGTGTSSTPPTSSTTPTSSTPTAPGITLPGTTNNPTSTKAPTSSAPGQQAPASSSSSSSTPAASNTPVTLSPGSFNLQSPNLTLKNANLVGVKTVTDYRGKQVKVLEFTANEVDIKDIQQAADLGNGLKQRIHGTSGATSVVSGPVVMDVSSMSSTGLTVLGVNVPIPLTLTPDSLGLFLAAIKLALGLANVVGLTLSFTGTNTNIVRLTGSQLYIPGFAESMSS